MKSLDARKKGKPIFRIRAEVSATPIPDGIQYQVPKINKNCTIAVCGMGPAGYFAARVLAEAGCSVILFDKGSDVHKRADAIQHFESTGEFTKAASYLYGEGGAGTFSDGKLTSRTKSIRNEKHYIFDCYTKSGAPEEIRFLARPHIGSDRLRKMMPVLRKFILEKDVNVLFDTELMSFTKTQSGKIEISTSSSNILADYLIVAPGHSSYKTYNMLMRHGIVFNPKRFAVGFRVEHSQILINRSQWGVENLSGINSAEYALTYNKNGNGVYSFCMCPGGSVVPAYVDKNHGGVNGASNYDRSSQFANSAIVVSFDPKEEYGTNLKACDLLSNLEEHTYKCADKYGNFTIPGNTISDFIKNKTAHSLPKSSYPFAVIPDSYKDFFPVNQMKLLRDGLEHFSKKIKGFESGLILGTEITSSAPLQVARNINRETEAVEKVYVVGEGSGFAGGIVSSAVDGIYAANDIISHLL